MMRATTFTETVLLVPRIQADVVAYGKSNSISSSVNTAYVATGNQKNTENHLKSGF